MNEKVREILRFKELAHANIEADKSKILSVPTGWRPEKHHGYISSLKAIWLENSYSFQVIT